MKTFRDFLFDIHDVIDLQEKSMSRLKDQSKSGQAIMSASRGDKSKKENRARAKQLDKDIKGKFGGRGATKVQGRYMEKDEKTGKERRVKERSHVIQQGKMSNRKFKKAVKKLGKKYDQDSVITQPRGAKGATLKRTRKGGLPKRNIQLGKMRPGRTGKDETKVKGKTFTYAKR